jgi:hypothetical protein
MAAVGRSWEAEDLEAAVEDLAEAVATLEAEVLAGLVGEALGAAAPEEAGEGSSTS